MRTGSCAHDGLSRGWLLLLALLNLLMLGAGPPVLSGTQPGSLRLYPKQLDAQVAAGRMPPVTAAAVLVADSDTQSVLLARNARQARPMASTTKIMTALVVLEEADLRETVVVSPNALAVGGASMGLTTGEALSVEDLLWGLLLNSGNDAAVALAEHNAGSEEAFVSRMNERAAELGLTATRFANSHGMDAAGHHSSAYDLWRLSEAALLHPEFREIVSTPVATVAGHPLWNRNELLTRYAGADGVKTGTTDLAGECLVASVTRDGHRVIVVVLGSQDRYADTIALLDHYFDFFRWGLAPQPLGLTAWLRGPTGRPYRVTAPEAPDLFLPRWQWPLVQVVPVLDEPPGDFAQPAGELRWYLGSELLARAPATWVPY